MYRHVDLSFIIKLVIYHLQIIYIYIYIPICIEMAILSYVYIYIYICFGVRGSSGSAPDTVRDEGACNKHCDIYICVYIYIYIHIYVYTEREREIEREFASCATLAGVGSSARSVRETRLPHMIYMYINIYIYIYRIHIYMYIYMHTYNYSSLICVFWFGMCFVVMLTTCNTKNH